MTLFEQPSPCSLESLSFTSYAINHPRHLATIVSQTVTRAGKVPAGDLAMNHSPLNRSALNFRLVRTQVPPSRYLWEEKTTVFDRTKAPTGAAQRLSIYNCTCNNLWPSMSVILEMNRFWDSRRRLSANHFPRRKELHARCTLVAADCMHLQWMFRCKVF